MRLLLDTNILIWVMGDDPMLSAVARRMIEEASAVHVSAVSIWEISIKAALGKLQIDMTEFMPQLGEAGFEPLTVSWDHVRAVHDLPHHHRDPFDRMLIAQAVTEPLRLLTHDGALARYSDLVTVV
ncbi:type II toxin-antitoxin system VapC family toxin [Inquilinus limosus]|uniref:Twitching motility protein PilT n=1 Tax=Inquilinus limosus MP06 TaxID=1398085 RepID=A0A0A0D8T7_9PROT|nr:type II toxin-antitoxin system VapC family toxin [Inquilinus limosus]KGM33342.1 twitching motility protein PilT [Inquilinus limosus MP06]